MGASSDALNCSIELVVVEDRRLRDPVRPDNSSVHAGAVEWHGHYVMSVGENV